VENLEKKVTNSLKKISIIKQIEINNGIHKRCQKRIFRSNSQ